MKLCWEAIGGALELCMRGPLTKPIVSQCKLRRQCKVDKFYSFTYSKSM